MLCFACPPKFIIVRPRGASTLTIPRYPLNTQPETLLTAVPVPAPRPDDMFVVLVYHDENVSHSESSEARALTALTICKVPASFGGGTSEGNAIDGVLMNH